MPHTLFPTALGTCALAWNDTGLTGFQLPERDVLITEKKIRTRDRCRESAPSRPTWVRQLVTKVQRHLDGTPQDFTTVPLDWSIVSDFQRATYEATRRIASGRMLSYGEIALRIGLTRQHARAIGTAMATNPWPLIVPCHRVVSANGQMHGYSAPGGIRTKTRILVLEGAELLSE